jgi:4-amino-4-deoxy-L-arabinose transferase-like glycosyltransferase
VATAHRTIDAEIAGNDSDANPVTRRQLTWATTAALGIVALAVRVAYWWTTADRPLSSDAAQYHELATNLADGHGFAMHFPQLELHATAFRPPAFPGLLSFVYRLTGSSPGVARLVAMLCGVLLVIVLHRVLLRHVTTSAAWLAAGLVALYPPLIANDTVPLTETPSLILLVVLADRVVARRWFVAGGLCGALVLTRPSAQGFVLVLAVWLWRRVGWGRALGVVVLVVTPWLVRNQLSLDDPTLVTSNGFNLAAIYSPEAEAHGAFVDPVFHPGFDDLRLAQFDEIEWDRQLRRRAFDNLRDNPWQVARVVGRNLVATGELAPSLNEPAERADARNLTVRTLTLPAFYLVSLAGIVGVLRYRRNLFVAFMGVSALYFLVPSLLLVAPPRLRAPFDLACCIGTALVLTGLHPRWSTHQVPSPASDATPSHSPGKAAATSSAGR